MNMTDIASHHFKLHPRPSPHTLHFLSPDHKAIKSKSVSCAIISQFITTLRGKSHGAMEWDMMVEGDVEESV